MKAASHSESGKGVTMAEQHATSLHGEYLDAVRRALDLANDPRVGTPYESKALDLVYRMLADRLDSESPGPLPEPTALRSLTPVVEYEDPIVDYEEAIVEYEDAMEEHTDAVPLPSPFEPFESIEEREAREALEDFDDFEPFWEMSAGSRVNGQDLGDVHDIDTSVPVVSQPFGGLQPLVGDPSRTSSVDHRDTVEPLSERFPDVLPMWEEPSAEAKEHIIDWTGTDNPSRYGHSKLRLPFGAVLLDDESQIDKLRGNKK